MRTFLRYQRLTIGWALFILIICDVDMGSVGSSPRFFPGFDKLVHCGLFFVFAAFIAYGILVKQRADRFTYKPAITAFATAVVFGALIELLQMFIFTWRSADWNDLFADTVGAGMAAFCSILILKAVKDEK